VHSRVRCEGDGLETRHSEGEGDEKWELSTGKGKRRKGKGKGGGGRRVGRTETLRL
jgi:hypothetical protein